MTAQGAIVLTGGGTGGHVMPALAVAQALQACAPEIPIHYVGGHESMEAELVQERGLPFHGLTVHPFFGKPVGTRIKAVCAIPPALFRAASILRKVKARATMAFGGYVSAAVGLVAPRLGIPLVLQEQNSVPGRTTRLLSKRASLVFLGFPDAQSAFSKNELLVTGNPVRAEIEAVSDATPPPYKPLRLLVLGGSQGALYLNENAPTAAQILQKNVGKIQVHHQCGRHDPKALEAAYAAANVDATVEPFIQDMASAYQGTHIALARAGALSVSELWCSSTPAVFVPFPYATDDHQFKNAESMVATGAARVLRQDAATAQELAKALTSLVPSTDQYEEYREQLRESARTRAAQQIAEATLRLVQNEKGSVS